MEVSIRPQATEQAHEEAEQITVARIVMRCTKCGNRKRSTKAPGTNISQATSPATGIQQPIGVETGY